jgi:3-isopropylmalate/(R)-2-methylmalate dehydratase small subunit
MKPFTTLTAVAAPIDMANIDTDRIIPVRFLRKLRNAEAGYEKYLFHDTRFDNNGQEKPEFVLNKAAFRHAGIIVAGANFGCGSSREGAVYALLDYGIRAVIAPSFGDIHYANELQNGMLPVTLPEEICRGLRDQLLSNPGATLSIDLPAQTVTDIEGTAHPFTIDPVYKERLLKGLDDIGLVMEQLPGIETFEHNYHTERPWLA